jgi:hypothetical protein
MRSLQTQAFDRAHSGSGKKEVAWSTDGTGTIHIKSTYTCDNYRQQSLVRGGEKLSIQDFQNISTVDNYCKADSLPLVKIKFTSQGKICNTKIIFFF